MCREGVGLNVGEYGIRVDIVEGRFAVGERRGAFATSEMHPLTAASPGVGHCVVRDVAAVEGRPEG